MNRTTILLDDNLVQRVKRRAQKEGKTFTGMIRQFVIRGLSFGQGPRKDPPRQLPSFRMGAAAVDPADRKRLWDLMDKQ